MTPGIVIVKNLAPHRIILRALRFLREASGGAVFIESLETKGPVCDEDFSAFKASFIVQFMNDLPSALVVVAVAWRLAPSF